MADRLTEGSGKAPAPSRLPDRLSTEGFYIVLKHGRRHAAFMFARNAEEYVNAPDGPGKFVTRDEGPLYKPEDFEIVAPNGRKVTGTTSHGHAILETLDRADARDQKES